MKNNHNKLIYIGGEVIDAGSYGCVFKPALRCKESIKAYNGISKLGMSSSIIKEWNTLQTVIKYIRKIPNYKKYFLLNDLEICSPASLTLNDKINFRTCVQTFERHNITESNINNYLSNFRIINMPYGGINIDTVVYKNMVDFNKLNKLMISLLINALIPMNNLSIYHLDLKAKNILYNNNNVKIIDFGALILYNNTITNKLLDNPIQFNTPLSRIILTDNFDIFLKEYLIDQPLYNLSQQSLYILFQKMCNIYYYKFTQNQVMLFGHKDYLSDIIIPDIYNLIYNNNYPQNIDFQSIISKYCAMILLKYVDVNSKIFNRQRYISEVYIKNVDIYGFIMSYLPYVSDYQKSRSTLNKDIHIVHNRQISIAKIIQTYCFGERYANIPININNLIFHLNNLSERIKKTKIKTKKSKTKIKTKKSKTKIKTKKSKAKTKQKTKSKSKKNKIKIRKTKAKR